MPPKRSPQLLPLGSAPSHALDAMRASLAERRARGGAGVAATASRSVPGDILKPTFQGPPVPTPAGATACPTPTAVTVLHSAPVGAALQQRTPQRTAPFKAMSAKHSSPAAVSVKSLSRRDQHASVTAQACSGGVRALPPPLPLAGGLREEAMFYLHTYGSTPALLSFLCRYRMLPQILLHVLSTSVHPRDFVSCVVQPSLNMYGGGDRLLQVCLPGCPVCYII